MLKGCSTRGSSSVFKPPTVRVSLCACAQDEVHRRILSTGQGSNLIQRMYDYIQCMCPPAPAPPPPAPAPPPPAPAPPASLPAPPPCSCCSCSCSSSSCSSSSSFSSSSSSSSSSCSCSSSSSSFACTFLLPLLHPRHSPPPFTTIGLSGAATCSDVVQTALTPPRAVRAVCSHGH